MRKVCLLICFTNIPPTANSIPCTSCIFSSKIAWHILLEKFTDQHKSINNKIHFIFFKYLESYYPQSIGLGLKHETYNRSMSSTKVCWTDIVFQPPCFMLHTWFNLIITTNQKGKDTTHYVQMRKKMSHCFSDCKTHVFPIRLNFNKHLCCAKYIMHYPWSLKYVQFPIKSITFLMKETRLR